MKIVFYFRNLQSWYTYDFFSPEYKMQVPTKIKNLCTPAMVYLVISVIALIPVMFQNIHNRRKYCVGNYQCMVPSTINLFIAKGIYIAIWTFFLDYLCRKGYKQISWVIVLLPFVLMFVLIASLMLAKGVSVIT
jgi:uncharacterized membrane protein